MGIKGLKKLIASVGKTVSLSSYKDKIALVDISIWLHKYLYLDDGTAILDRLRGQITLLQAHGVIPIYVFDGAKNKEIKIVSPQRTQTKEALKRDLAGYVHLKQEIADRIANSNVDSAVVTNSASDLSILNTKISSLEARTRDMPVNIIAECKQLCDEMKVSYLQSTCEADTLIAYICCSFHRDSISTNNIDSLFSRIGRTSVTEQLLTHDIAGVLSEDTDMLPYGCPTLIAELKGSSAVEYHLDDVLRHVKMSYIQFVDFCILCGCDYSEKITNVAIVRAKALITKYGSIERIITFIDSVDNSNGRYTYSPQFMTQMQIARNMFIRKSPTNTESMLCEHSCDILIGEKAQLILQGEMNANNTVDTSNALTANNTPSANNASDTNDAIITNDTIIANDTASADYANDATDANTVDTNNATDTTTAVIIVGDVVVEEKNPQQ